MTKEQARLILLNQKQYVQDGSAVDEAYDTAIAALEQDKMAGTQMSLPECEDAVSRKKAFEYFTQLWDDIGTIMDRSEWEDVCKATANELPPVTPDLSDYSDRLWRAAYERGKKDALAKAGLDQIVEPDKTMGEEKR